MSFQQPLGSDGAWDLSGSWLLLDVLENAEHELALDPERSCSGVGKCSSDAEM